MLQPQNYARGGSSTVPFVASINKDEIRSSTRKKTDWAFYFADIICQGFAIGKAR